MTNQTNSSNYFLIFSFIFLYLIFTNSAIAADINSVFQDVDTKTDSIMDWVTNRLVYFVALAAFIGWGMAMYFKMMTYVDGIKILIITIFIGSAGAIVSVLIKAH